MDHLLRLVEESGLRLVERAGPTRGGYDHSALTIRLAPGMSVRTTTSVLAHELGHATLGHTVSAHPEVRARQERRADEWAARLLISPEAYAAAEAVRGPHRASLAFELGVTVELVEAYQRMLQRIGTSVYVAPRMGAGQWAHRVAAE
ncbi:ImmA/IrrE family metallo-endopeptidase [Microbacterium sp. SSW1-49]|uniref:ImmA/IrrE family metallo-endopeptidase n=1 Tax=Microbacterium croceum TaxID=2851645 RepID=A0ABT0FHB3_9MICO|nr:ImmA/IrrE family metallo-endopeptidase [Microbacterium croceum]MCK2037450.1 ImmA/IrrE family metallo-endopeptidase [Microbacterium croceum]